MHHDTQRTSGGGGIGVAPPDALLTGVLPCVTCGYELRGLSVRDVCPECGTAVRATILSVVDPLADELAPLRAPSLTGVLIVAWALASALGVWLILAMRLLDGLRAMGVRAPEFWWGWNATFVLLIVSGVSSLGFLTPTTRTRPRGVLAASLATLAYMPFFYALVRIRAIDVDQGVLRAFFTLDPDPARIAWRLVCGVCLLVIFLGVRPNARELVRRSLAMRTGRVDRQTLLAMAAAVGVMMTGDALRLVGTTTGVQEAVIVGGIAVLIATVFLAFGLSAAVVDGWRIRRSLRMGPRRIGDLIASPETPGRGSD
ncbi:MAG: hypothetical protein Tsb0013_13230 [Phycisphaerales bacterium]